MIQSDAPRSTLIELQPRPRCVLHLAGPLKDGKNVGLGPNKRVGLYYHYEGKTDWNYWTPLETDANGYFSTTTSDRVTYYARATFPGDSRLRDIDERRC